MKIRLSIACVVLTLLFALPLWGAPHAPVYLSISDPELGSLVLKKDNPLKETGGGLGGLSVGEYTYKGESIQIQMYRGEPLAAWYRGERPDPELKYSKLYNVSMNLYDRGGMIISVSGGQECIFLPGIPPAWVFDKKLQNMKIRENLLLKMAALLKKHFAAFRDWHPEMHMLFNMRTFYEEERAIQQRSREDAKQGNLRYVPDQLGLGVYYKNADWAGITLSSKAFHSATRIGRYRENEYGMWDFWTEKMYCNYGTCPEVGSGMNFSCAVYGVVGDIPLESQMLCATPYGYRTGQHVCNDCTMLQIFYVKHGYFASRYNNCCADNVLNVDCPSCYCCN